MSSLRFGRYRVELSNTEKLLFPDSDIDKGALIDYYREVAAVMLPHLKDRPLSLQRFPDGIGKPGFYQQQSADYFPDWIRTRKTPRADNGDAVEHVVCNNQATLVYLANQAAITLHGWLARVPRISRPDRLIFDLDPPDHDFSTVRRAARQVVELMQAMEMTPFVMTTGSRGLHVVAPLRADADFDSVRGLAQDMATVLAGRHRESLTVEQRKQKRRGRLYLDVTRNAYGQTTVMPYAVRALPGAPVATPLDIAELGNSRLAPQRWNLKNILRRLGRKADPWADIRHHATSAGRIRRALCELQEN